MTNDKSATNRSKGDIEGDARGLATTACAEQGRACWGDVNLYSFDLDLPTVALCQGHLWSLRAGARS